MTKEQIARRAVIHMWSTGLLAMVALVGSMVLAAHQRPGYAIIWLGFGIANVAMYVINLRVYRQAGNRRGGMEG